MLDQSVLSTIEKVRINFMQEDFTYPSKLAIIKNTLLARYSSKAELSFLKKIVETSEMELELNVGYDRYVSKSLHKLNLYVPFKIYLLIGTSSSKFEFDIECDINDVGKIQGEKIGCVSILVKDSPSFADAGTSEVDETMWNTGFRVFISHRVEDKAKATELKKQLAKYGITAFVAHEDIEPSKEWMTTIENALLSMDAFVALVTEGYNDKFWTQQEIGFAYCMNKMKGIPFVSIRMGDDPKGFFGYVQAFSPQDDDYVESLCEQWIDHPRMIDSLIVALQKSSSYSDSARYYELLKKTTNITDKQVKKLVSAFNENTSVNKCYKMNGYVGSILEFISGKTSEQYQIVTNPDNSCSLVPKE